MKMLKSIGLPAILAVACMELLGITGCASRTPTWSKASAEQRANGQFVEDDAYMVSPQFTNDINESVDTIIRLRKQRAGQ